MRLLLIFLAVLWVVPARSQPQPFATGVDFMRTCEKPATDTVLAFCSAYATGLRDMAFTLRSTRAIKDVGPCDEAFDLGGRDVLGILINWLKVNPQYAAPGSTWETAGLYWFALSARYPCWAPSSQPTTPPRPPADRRL